MSAFKWKNREFCIRRIFALVTCKGIELNKATRLALEKMDQDGSFIYCNHPDYISGSELIRLREHAAALIESKGKEDMARQLTISGIEGGIAEGFLYEPIIPKRFITEKQLHRAYNEQRR